MKNLPPLLYFIRIFSIALFISGCAKQDKPTENVKIDIDQALQIFGTQVDPQPQITAATPFATVNGTLITHGQLQSEMQNLAKRLPATLAPEQRQQAQQQLANKAVQNLIQASLIKEAINSSNRSATTEEVDAKIELVKQQLKDGQTLDSELAKQNMNQEQYRTLIGQQITMNSFFEEISSSAATSTEIQVKKFYDENTERFTRAAGVEARHILFKATTEDTGELFVQKKKAARAALKRLNAGESFEKLIIELSEGPNTQKGGVLGFLQQGNTAPEIAEHIFDLKEGESTGVVRTQYGFHILQVTKIHEALTVGYDEAKEQISQLLLKQNKQKLIEDYVSVLREKADIQILKN